MAYILGVDHGTLAVVVEVADTVGGREWGLRTVGSGKKSGDKILQLDHRIESDNVSLPQGSGGKWPTYKECSQYDTPVSLPKGTGGTWPKIREFGGLGSST